MELSTQKLSDEPGAIGPVLALVVAVAVFAAFVGSASPAMAESKLTPLVVVDYRFNPDPAISRLFESNEPVGPEVPPSMRAILTEVCAERGYDETCAKILYGMMWKESLFVSDAVGDNGRALGYFQIHYRLHGVSPECATDVRCSATWSLGYLESNGYPKYKTHAVQCHNGCGAGNGYAASVQRWGDRKWAQADVEEEEHLKALAALEAEAAERQAEAVADEGSRETGDLPNDRMAYLMTVGNREERN